MRLTRLPESFSGFLTTLDGTGEGSGKQLVLNVPPGSLVQGHSFAEFFIIVMPIFELHHQIMDQRMVLGQRSGQGSVTMPTFYKNERECVPRCCPGCPGDGRGLFGRGHPNYTLVICIRPHFYLLFTSQLFVQETEVNIFIVYNVSFGVTLYTIVYGAWDHTYLEFVTLLLLQAACRR